MIEKYFTWLFYADFIIPLIIIGAVFLFWAVCRLAVLIARGWDKRQKRLADKHYEADKEAKKEMCGKAILGGVCPKDCERCAWNIAEKEMEC